MMQKCTFLTVLFFVVGFAHLLAQDYRAMHGSNYGGSLTVYNNPASIVFVPHKWDITPLAIHTKQSTNMLVINNSSLLAPAKSTTVSAVNGKSKKFLLANQDLRLLNTRFSIGKSSAIAIGVNIRNYQSVKTSKFNWQDSMVVVRDFMMANELNQPHSVNLNANSWAEIYGTYARTVFESASGIFNAGVTITINRGLAGAYVNATNLSFQPAVVNGQPGYEVSGGDGRYGYSSNFDEFNNGGSDKEKRKRFLKRTQASLGISLGAEYILPLAADEGSYYDYDFKLGVAILDIGKNKFQYGINSAATSLSKQNISDSILNDAFLNIANFDDVTDSIRRISATFSRLSGGFFFIGQPTRLSVNADKRIGDNLFINASFSLPLSSLVAKDNLYATEMTLASLTPRLENKSFGIYLPASLSSNMKFWIGGAFRAGPLLFGLHNWANLFSKNKMQNGGMYLALTFRPGNRSAKNGEDNSYGTGEVEHSRKKAKTYDCPSVN